MYGDKTTYFQRSNKLLKKSKGKSKISRNKQTNKKFLETNDNENRTTQNLWLQQKQFYKGNL